MVPRALSVFIFTYPLFYSYSPEFSSQYHSLYFGLFLPADGWDFGDAKLAISLGWLLGLSRALSGIVVSFWIGAIIGIALVIFSKKYGMKSQIPFAPYLVLGAFLAFILGLSLFPLF